MSTYESVEDALAHTETAESLRLSCKGLSALPDSIAELKNLRVLRLDDVPAGLAIPDSLKQMANLVKLDVSGADDGSVAFPQGLLETSVTELSLRQFRIREVFSLADQVKRLRLASYWIFDDMEPLFTHFKRLEYLEVWGYHARDAVGNKKSLLFGPEVANLTELAELEVVSAGMHELPAELASLKNLRVVRLRNNAFVDFPAALAALPNLESLEFAHMSSLTSFPPEIATMHALRVLDLNGSWNGGALPSEWEEEDENYEPLPAVLGELGNLEVLSVDQCAVGSLEVISRLSNLRELSAEWAALTDLAPIRALKKLEKLRLSQAWIEDIKPLAELTELRELDISKTNVANLEPLAKSSKLEVLNISRAAVDRKNPLKALEALVDLPLLETVQSSELEEGAWAKLRGAQPVDTAGLVAQLGADDFAHVMAALNEIIEHSVERSTYRHNALIDLFELEVDDYDTTLIAFQPLDDALERWGREVSPADLARLVQATFVNTSDGWNATIKAVELLIESKNVEGQLGVIDAWDHATGNYDGGHREWGSGVHDRMIDDFWIQFRPEVLVAFLPTLDGDQLDSEYGDGLDVLFEPAIESLQAPDEDLFECLREYAVDRAHEPDQVLALIDDCIAAATADTVKAALREIEQAVRDEAEPSEASEASEAAETGPERTLTIQALDDAYKSPDAEMLIALLDVAAEEEIDASMRKNAAIYTNNKLIMTLKADDDAEGRELMRSYETFFRQTGAPDGNIRAELAINTFFLLSRSRETSTAFGRKYVEQLERFLLEALVPEHIVNAMLAFNLACHWAIAGEKEKLLEMTTLARELGKPAEQFADDADFAAYIEDPEFREAAGLEPVSSAGEAAAARRFEYHDEKSHKFWAVAVEGAQLHLNWGRVGSDGQRKSKDFADPAAAEKECAKLIKQKTGKGYEEI